MISGTQPRISVLSLFDIFLQWRVKEPTACVVQRRMDSLHVQLFECTIQITIINISSHLTLNNIPDPFSHSWLWDWRKGWMCWLCPSWWIEPWCNCAGILAMIWMSTTYKITCGMIYTVERWMMKENHTRLNNVLVIKTPTGWYYLVTLVQIFTYV